MGSNNFPVRLDEPAKACSIFEVIAEAVERGQGVHPVDLAVHPELVNAAQVRDTRLPPDPVDDRHDILRRLADLGHLLNLAHCVGELQWGKVRRVVVCDSPQISLGLGAPGSAVKTTSIDPLAVPVAAAAQAREGTPLAGSGTGARSAP